MSCNLDDMTLVKCAYHSRGHVTRVDVALDHFVMDAAVVVVAVEAPAQFCVPVGVQFVVVAVVGSVIVIAVADMEFQYLQIVKIVKKSLIECLLRNYYIKREIFRQINI